MSWKIENIGKRPNNRTMECTIISKTIRIYDVVSFVSILFSLSLSPSLFLPLSLSLVLSYALIVRIQLPTYPTTPELLSLSITVKETLPISQRIEL